VNDWTGHGGRIDTARTAFPDAPRPWLDLSTGINPTPWTGIDLGAIDLAALPAPTQLAELETAAAAMFGASASQVAAVPGTEIGLRALDLLGLPGPLRHVAPTYRTHAEVFPGSISISIDDLEREADRGGTILLANPNNPDGRITSPDRLVVIAARLRERGGWLVVDEAFADAVPEASIVPSLMPEDHVIVLRSFGKFFGLAGLRLGFVIAPAPQIDAIRHRLGSWPVSSPALAVGTAAYRDESWVAATRKMLLVRAGALDAVLSGHGLTVIGDCPLFRLIAIEDAAWLFDRLARAGILTRPFDYVTTWLRLGLHADDAALERLDRALARG
jgi:cobalamin biosynthetic protein CobC